jgi:hypothetical protein
VIWVCRSHSRRNNPAPSRHHPPSARQQGPGIVEDGLALYRPKRKKYISYPTSPCHPLPICSPPSSHSFPTYDMLGAALTKDQLLSVLPLLVRHLSLDNYICQYLRSDHHRSIGFYSLNKRRGHSWCKPTYPPLSPIVADGRSACA